MVDIARREFLAGAAAAAVMLTGQKLGAQETQKQEGIIMTQKSKEHKGPFSIKVPFLFGYTGITFSGAQDAKTLRQILEWYTHRGIASKDGPPAVLEIFMGFGDGQINPKESDKVNIARYSYIRPLFEEFNVVGSALIYPHEGSNLDMISNDRAKRLASQRYVELVSKVAYEAFGCLQSIGPLAAEAVRAAKRTNGTYALMNAVPHLREAAEYVRKLDSNYVIAPEAIRWQESVVSKVDQISQLLTTVKHPNLKRHADTAHGREEQKYQGPDGMVQYINDIIEDAATVHISEHADVTEAMLAGQEEYDPRNRAALEPDGHVGGQLDGIMYALIEAQKKGLRVTLETPTAAMRKNLLRGEFPVGLDGASALTLNREAYATAARCLTHVSLAVDNAAKRLNR